MRSDGYKNLINPLSRPLEERVAIAKKVAKQSALVKKQRKQLKELFKSMLSTPITDEKLKKEISKMGFEEEESNYNTLLGLNTLKLALKGNMKATEFIRDTIGEKPKEEIEVNNVMPKCFKIKDEEEQEANTKQK